MWDVLWDDLVTMELTHGKKDQPRSPPSRLILYLQSSRSTELKEQFRVIKCIPETRQSLEVYSSIEQALYTYGPNHSKVSSQCHIFVCLFERSHVYLKTKKTKTKNHVMARIFL